MLVMKAIVIFSPDPSSHPYHTHREVVFDRCDMLHGPTNQAQAAPAQFHNCYFEDCRFTMTQEEVKATFTTCWYERCQFGVSHETILKEGVES